MAELRAPHVVCGGILAGAAVLAYWASQRSGGWNAPKYATEDASMRPSPVNVIQPDPQAGYRYTCHRYPARTGHEITSLIQGGHSAASVPRHLPEAYWMTSPPSELVL